MSRQPVIAVVGGGANVSGEVRALADGVGRAIAAHRATLVCGGLGGVMEAAARGASEAGGTTIGILPGTDPHEANPWIDHVVATGMGHARNVAVVTSADAVIALAGEAGTLSEIALARVHDRPVVALASWVEIPGLLHAADADEAVELALAELAYEDDPR